MYYILGILSICFLIVVWSLCFVASRSDEEMEKMFNKKEN